MLGSEDGKKDQPPPPQEGEKGVLQAKAWAEDKVTTQQGEASPEVVWTGYGHYSMVYGQCTKAKIAEEFYARNVLVQNPKLVQHNLDLYQKCHIAHQRRCLACNSLFNQNQTVAVGSAAHSLSKNQLEDANRGLNREVADRSMHGDSTDYDTEGDDDMQQVLAVMPSLTALPLASSFPQPPATSSRAGLQELQSLPTPPSTFPSAIGLALLRHDAMHGMPLAFEAEQAEKVMQSSGAVLTSDEDDAPPGLISSDEEDALPRLEAVVLMPNTDTLMPHIDVLMPSTGLLMFSMEQLHVALDSHLQMFTAMTEDEKKEETKKEGDDDEHLDEDVTLENGQNKDAASGEEKDGGSSTPT